MLNKEQLAEIDKLKDFRYIQNKIKCSLINKSLNNNRYYFTKDIENTEFALAYYIDCNGFIVKMTEELMSYYNITPAKLHELALQNRPENDTLIMSMSEELHIGYDISTFVISNKQMSYGAINALYNEKEAIQQVCKIIQTDKLFVIFSSVHEVICQKYDGEFSIASLIEVIASVNETLNKKEVLSYKLYIYDLANNRLEPCE